MRPSIHRQRQHERGAALVEAAFMFPMFIILFFSVIYAHSFTATKIDEATQARELAWNNAMTNCVQGGGGSDSETLPDLETSLSLTRGNFKGTGTPSTIGMNTTSKPLTPMNGEAGSTQAGVTQSISGGSIEGAFAGIVGMLLDTVAKIFPDPNGAQGVTTGSVSWRLPNNYAHTDPNNSTSLTHTVTVYCNEAPQDGSVKTVVGDLVGDISNFVTSKL
jgi:hypothetical protein